MRYDSTPTIVNDNGISYIFSCVDALTEADGWYVTLKYVVTFKYAVRHAAPPRRRRSAELVGPVHARLPNKYKYKYNSNKYYLLYYIICISMYYAF
jgi:hypothetical protein